METQKWAPLGLTPLHGSRARPWQKCVEPWATQQDSQQVWSHGPLPWPRQGRTETETEMPADAHPIPCKHQAVTCYILRPSCQGLNCVLLKFMCCRPTSRTSKCDLEVRLFRADQVEKRRWRLALIQTDCILLRRATRHTDNRDAGTQSTDCARTQRAGGRLWARRRGRRRNDTCGYLHLGLPASRKKKHIFLLLKPVHLWHFATATKGNSETNPNLRGVPGPRSLLLGYLLMLPLVSGPLMPC